MKGKFITFEGGEGAGKSTQIQLLRDYLESQNIPYVLTREPGGTPAAEEIRSVLKKGGVNKFDAIAETLLFSAARRSHLVDKIWPAVGRGEWVICDRYADSTMAYQGYGRTDPLLTPDDLNALYYLIAGDFKPDLTFILDIDPASGFARVHKREEGKVVDDRFEAMDKSFHENLRKAYLKIAEKEPERCVVINANQTPDVVHAQVVKVLKDRLR